MRIHKCVLSASVSVVVLCAAPISAQAPPAVRNADGLRMFVAPENTHPTLRIQLPGSQDNAIEVIFPEHVTARKVGSDEAEHLYLFSPGREGSTPQWRQVDQSLEYEMDLKGGIHFLARATLVGDGVLFHYEFLNRSNAAFAMIYAVTDPRMTSIFHDVRLERTYVHHKDGFDLLASETPSRLTMPMSEWLPSRYLASFTWPVPAQRMERRGDGITYYNKSRAVDEPMIATLSIDRKWVVASFTRTTGNVWSNPELTCQHVDPTASLSPGQLTVLEVKILIFKGSLEQALQKVTSQRDTLK
jgi:hypothetical protein